MRSACRSRWGCGRWPAACLSASSRHCCWRVESSGASRSLNGIVHLPLVMPPVVTGYLLLLSFGRRGPIGAFLAENFGIVFSFRWTGAALACAVMGFPLMVRAIRLSIEAVDRRLEAAAGTLGAGPLWVFSTVTLPLDPAGHRCRHDPFLRQGDGRIRRHHHLRLQHPRRDPDAALGDLYLHASARRRRGCDAADADLDRHLDGGADGFRSACPPHRPQDSSNDAAGRYPSSLGRAEPRRKIREWRPPDGAVRAVRLRQDLAHQPHRRPDPARRRPHRHRRPDAGRHRTRHLRSRPQAPRRLRLPGRAAVSRI